MLRHTWATNYHRSASGSRFDLKAERRWRTGRMVERYTKSRPFEERRRGPSPLTAFREAMKGEAACREGLHNRRAPVRKTYRVKTQWRRASVARTGFEPPTSYLKGKSG